MLCVCLRRVIVKIVVIGGIGFIGSKVVRNLIVCGYDVVVVVLLIGVDMIIGVGLDDVLVGVEVVVDFVNLLLFEEVVVKVFFEVLGCNLFVVECVVGVCYYVVLLVVGIDWLQQSVYFCGKIIQENLICEVGVLYMIVCLMQFFEFVGVIVQVGVQGDMVWLIIVYFQLIVLDDVVVVVIDFVFDVLCNGIVEIGGFECVWIVDLVECFLLVMYDVCMVMCDVSVDYFGVVLQDDMFVLVVGVCFGVMIFDVWFWQNVFVC